ncbi:FxSxx-COOH system tetratricopeptide repeat protein [Nocardia sp. NPDC052278]|uniref:FxSxx-COOH system tetratricopeptide repeat protein n=1 Tax=unclassified Nocardia TaxID=2637762 RepID=UPI003686182D
MVPQQPVDFITRAPLGRLRKLVHRSPVVVVVTGMRGVGKTELAAAYAREVLTGDGEGLVGWVNAESRGVLLEGLAAIAQRLGVDDPNGDSEVSAHRLREFWTGRPVAGLLVLDNATAPDEVKAFLPAATGIKVVITSTEHAFTTLGAALDLTVYTRRESLRYLKKATKLADTDGADRVGRELGDLPLALTQAAATIERLGIDYETYLGLLAGFGDQAFTRIAGHEYPLQVHRAILLSIATTEASSGDPALDTAVRGVLELVAMLSPAGVARDLLPDYGGRRDEAVARCVQASLLTRSVDRTAVVMHRLVARVIRDRADSDQARARLLGYALDVIEPCLFDRGQAWQRRIEGAGLIDHIDAITATGLTGLDPDDTARVVNARIWAGNQLTAAADLARAIDYTRRTLLDAETHLGAEHRHILSTRHNLADAYRSAGRPGEAIALLERLLPDRERVLGAEHPDTLSTRYNLAGAYRTAGRPGEAIALLERLLPDRERVLGAEHPGTLSTRHNLAGAYRAVGRADEAITLYEQVLPDRKRLLGAEHPDTLSTCHNLARAYLSLGRTGEAIALYEQVLPDRERVLGAEHPSTLSTRYNLAYAYESVGRTGEAIALYEQVLPDWERMMGTEHVGTLSIRYHLADAYESVGRTGEAIALYEQLLPVVERVFDHDVRIVRGVRERLAAVGNRPGLSNRGVQIPLMSS